jgi:hypothetical protein
MKALSEVVDDALASKGSKVVFSNEIDRIWPPNAKEIQARDDAIHAFAKERRWTAAINNAGVRVTFRKAGSPPV